MKPLNKTFSIKNTANEMITALTIQIPNNLYTVETALLYLEMELFEKANSETHFLIEPDNEELQTIEHVLRREKLLKHSDVTHSFAFCPTTTIVKLIVGFEQNPDENLKHINEILEDLVKKGKVQKFYQRNINPQIINIDFYADDVYVKQTIEIKNTEVGEKEFLSLLNSNTIQTSINHTTDKIIFDKDNKELAQIIDQLIITNTLENFSITI